MEYMVIWSDGQKFGPADIAMLNQWIADGRIKPETELESVVDGTRLSAASLPGLNFGGMAAQPAAPSEPTPVASAPSGGAAEQYFVVGADGGKYGPADAATLTQWAAENRLNPNSELESASTGMRTMASQVSGIIFPVAAAAAANPMQQAPTGQYGGATPMTSNYPRNEYTDPNAGKTELIISYVMSAVGLLCCPCIFSVGGIILGNMATKKGNPGGKTAMYVGIASLVAGFVIGAIINMSNPAFQQLMRGGN